MSFIHNRVTGSYLGFPNPRYMSSSVFVEELSVWLMAVGMIFLVAMLVFLALSFATPVMMVSTWPVIAAVSCGGVSALLNLLSLTLQMFSR